MIIVNTSKRKKNQNNSQETVTTLFTRLTKQRWNTIGQHPRLSNMVKYFISFQGPYGNYGNLWRGARALVTDQFPFAQQANLPRPSTSQKQPPVASGFLARREAAGENTRFATSARGSFTATQPRAQAQGRGQGHFVAEPHPEQSLGLQQPQINLARRNQV